MMVEKPGESQADDSSMDHDMDGNINSSGDSGNDVEMHDQFEDEDIEDGDSFPESEEFQSINRQLDALNSALDKIEEKNDNILAELIELLNENRQIRKELQGE